MSASGPNNSTAEVRLTSIPSGADPPLTKVETASAPTKGKAKLITTREAGGSEEFTF